MQRWVVGCLAVPIRCIAKLVNLLFHFLASDVSYNDDVSDNIIDIWDSIVWPFYHDWERPTHS